MCLHLNRSRIILCLLCIIFCINLTACAEQVSGENGSVELDSSSLEDASSVSRPKEFDISIPEEITMDFLGINLLKTNRPIWEKHIFSLDDRTEEDYIIQFYIGDYEIFHSYLNFENQENLSATINYKENWGCATIQYDENDKLSKIDIFSDMGEEFSTSFLNIGDNVKDYFESFKTGLWDKFLNGENIVVERGWYVRYSTAVAPEYTYDVLQVGNKDLLFSYFIKDELVHYIMLSVVGDINRDGELETEPSIYQLDEFVFYLNGIDIFKLSIDEWINSMNFTEAERKKFELGETFWAPLDGTEVMVCGQYKQDIEDPWGNFTFYNINDVVKHVTPMVGVEYSVPEDITYRSDEIHFSIVNGCTNRKISITGECAEITGNYIMPGDNVKTFLNSYEEGLYETIVSLPDSYTEYREGPYRFQFHRGTDNVNTITIRKDDERNNPAVSLIIDNEIVTKIYIE